MKQQILEYIEINGHPTISQYNIRKAFDFKKNIVDILGQLEEENRILSREGKNCPVYQILDNQIMNKNLDKDCKGCEYDNVFTTSKGCFELKKRKFAKKK